MRKWIIGLLILCVVFIASLYLFIPGIIKIERSVTVGINQPGLYRSLSNFKNWADWWPADREANPRSLKYNGYEYTLTDVKTLSLELSITKDDHKAISFMNLVKPMKDSCSISWETRIPSSYNPFKRLQRYMDAKKIESGMDSLLSRILTYYASTKNMYGYDIRKEFVVDSILVSNFRTGKGYPTVATIYQLIDELKQYIGRQGATEKGYPMLNIFTTDSINYTTKVAIPVDRKLPDSGNISYRWMLPGGNILITEVKGGETEIDRAFRQIETYISDHQRVAPAIPFLSLVTDRRVNTDTSQWITRIYYPVM